MSGEGSELSCEGCGCWIEGTVSGGRSLILRGGGEMGGKGEDFEFASASFARRTASKIVVLNKLT